MQTKEIKLKEIAVIRKDGKDAGFCIGIVAVGSLIGQVTIEPNNRISKSLLYCYPNEGIDGNYIAKFLEEYDYEPLKKGKAQPRICIKDLEDIIIPFPPKSE